MRSGLSPDSPRQRPGGWALEAVAGAAVPGRIGVRAGELGFNSGWPVSTSPLTDLDATPWPGLECPNPPLAKGCSPRWEQKLFDLESSLMADW